MADKRRKKRPPWPAVRGGQWPRGARLDSQSMADPSQLTDPAQSGSATARLRALRAATAGERHRRRAGRAQRSRRRSHRPPRPRRVGRAQCDRRVASGLLVRIDRADPTPRRGRHARRRICATSTPAYPRSRRIRTAMSSFVARWSSRSPRAAQRVADRWSSTSTSGSSRRPIRRRRRKKVFRCTFCKEPGPTGELRVEPVDEQDIAAAHSMGETTAALTTLLARFPIPAPAPSDGFTRRTAEDPRHPLPDELLGLYTPRTLSRSSRSSRGSIPTCKAAAVDAGIRLGLAHALLSLSRLNGYPGRVAALRVRHGHVQQPTAPAWRERNPWLAFEEGCREVRALHLARRERRRHLPAATGRGHGGADRRHGQCRAAHRAGGMGRQRAAVLVATGRSCPGRLDPRSRVRLVLTQPPVRWSVENVSFAYLATSIVLGKQAAASICRSIGSSVRHRATTAAARRLRCGARSSPCDQSWPATQPRSSCSTRAARAVSSPACSGGVGAGFRLNSRAAGRVGQPARAACSSSISDHPTAERQRPCRSRRPPSSRS